MSGESRLHRIPYPEDPLVYLADLILARHADTLPDLGAHAVVLPSYGGDQRFRRILLGAAAERGHSALIPPTIDTLAGWVRRFQDTSRAPLSDNARELLLVQALQDFPALRRQYGTWPLIDSLLPLFDELVLNRVHIGTSEPEFGELLTQAYGASAQVAEPLGQESRLVFRLWQAWQETLEAEHTSDRSRSYVESLARSLAHYPGTGHIYVAGMLRFGRAELDWIDALAHAGSLDLIIHAGDAARAPATEAILEPLTKRLDASCDGSSPYSAYGAFLDRALGTTEPDLASRAHMQAGESTNSPACERLTVCAPADSEYEARAIDIQVRRWRLQGVNNIGIVTNDRKLARRVRALLERSGIDLADAAGWTLSTTSAAAALIQWLDCIEQDYFHNTLFSFLRSPYHGLMNDVDSDLLLRYLQRQCVRRGHTFRGLRRFRQALEQQAASLADEDEALHQSSLELLNRLEQAQRGLAPLVHGETAMSAGACFEALLAGMGELGMTAALEQDQAGTEVLSEMDSLRRTLASSTVPLDWSEFRAWLHRKLERARFRPTMRGVGVELMGFGESRLYRFDALVVAGATREHLPGGLSDSPFFNESVRRQLGLNSLSLHQQELFHDFRRLLEAAPHVLITYARQQQGQDTELSPWVERLQAFHQAAYGSPLAAGSLEAWSYEAETQLHRDHRALPEVQTRPAALLPAEIVPNDYSSSAYQSLIDCPYQFFARYALGLKEEEVPEEDLDKSGYGTRVHRILEAFHGGRPPLSGPFTGAITADTVDKAREMLEEISHQVFRPDADRNPINRAWYYRWLETIPHYLAWACEHDAGWFVTRTELELRREEDGEGLTLHGRVDRLERARDGAGAGIVDYKTGRGASYPQVAAGESVQLPFYALLLMEPVACASTLVLDPRQVQAGTVLENGELEQLRDAQIERLQSIHRRLRKGGTPLPAWGDEDSCRCCDLPGLCRKGLRQEPDLAASPDS